MQLQPPSYNRIFSYSVCFKEAGAGILKVTIPLASRIANHMYSMASV